MVQNLPENEVFLFLLRHSLQFVAEFEIAFLLHQSLQARRGRAVTWLSVVLLG
jgi:hypothetical protein